MLNLGYQAWKYVLAVVFVLLALLRVCHITINSFYQVGRAVTVGFPVGLLQPAEHLLLS
jgi:hypothetical protein